MAKKWYPVIDILTCQECGSCVAKCTHGVYDKSKAPVPVVVNPEGCIDHCHGCGTFLIVCAGDLQINGGGQGVVGTADDHGVGKVRNGLDECHQECVAQARQDQADALSQEARALSEQLETLREEIEQLSSYLEENRDAAEKAQEELEYLQGVYDALKDGLTQVEGYIAGN